MFKSIKEFFASVAEAIIEARKAEADMVVRRFKGQ
jgi:hypothetical protein